jgi:hypothetical protein
VGVSKHTETPFPLLAVTRNLIFLGQTELVLEIFVVESEHAIELVHHPGKSNVGHALVVVAATNARVHTREPDLDEVLMVHMWVRI